MTVVWQWELLEGGSMIDWVMGDGVGDVCLCLCGRTTPTTWAVMVETLGTLSKW